MPASTLAPSGPRRALAVTLVGLAAVAVALFLFWPARLFDYAGGVGNYSLPIISPARPYSGISR